MTEPANQPPPEDQPPTESDEDSLMPVLLTVMALYLLWRGANHSFRGNALTVRRALDLDRVIGQALAGVAARALNWQRGRAGRAGDELWAAAPAAVREAVDVGLTVLSEALLWMDRHVVGDPSTSDAGTAGPGEAKVPTAEDPPSMLARMLTTAVTNAAMTAAGRIAGWESKTWHTRRDDRVRTAHRILGSPEHRTVPISEPFTVDGHKIWFPGDPSVPIELRANCRCWLTLGR